MPGGTVMTALALAERVVVVVGSTGVAVRM
jgi:hypothetical protein